MTVTRTVSGGILGLFLWGLAANTTCINLRGNPPSTQWESTPAVCDYNRSGDPVMFVPVAVPQDGSPWFQVQECATVCDDNGCSGPCGPWVQEEPLGCFDAAGQGCDSTVYHVWP